MFVLSKLFWIAAQPVMIVLLLLFWGLLRRRRWMLWAATLLLAALALTPIGQVLISPLENRFPRPALPETVTGIIALGGGEAHKVSLARGRLEVNDGGDRLIELARLARRYPDARVVFTGGSGSILGGDSTAGLARDALLELGIEPERIVLETKSRNTYENAVLTKRLVDPQQDETWLLITSAFHMPRSLGIFRGAGWAVTPWPTDHRIPEPESSGRLSLDTVLNIQTANTALREWIGLAYYRALGRIPVLFPGSETISPAPTGNQR